jgi:hypothetical protein
VPMLDALVAGLSTKDHMANVVKAARAMGA